MNAKILIILILPAVLASCGKEITRYDLTEAQKQIIPYEKGQVISFIDSGGQTIDLTVRENKTEWAFINDYLMYRSKLVSLKSESSILSISLEINSEDRCFGKDHCSFKIGIYGEYFDLIVDTKGNFFINSSMAFHDSLQINGKVYSDVVEKNEGSKQLFYNKTYGILQVKGNGANILTLKD